MARGNQRDKAREATQKKLAAQVSPPPRPVISALSEALISPAQRKKEKTTVTLLSAQRAALGHALPYLGGCCSLLPPGGGGGGGRRQKERKKKGQARCTALLTPSLLNVQKSKNTKTGAEMQRDKDQVAEMMRKKQAAGKAQPPSQGATCRGA